MAKNENKESNFDIIRRHLFSDQTIDLTHQQQQLMDRWNCAMELRTCENMKTKDIIIKLMEKFGVERATAFNDIGWAESLYGYSNPLNKRYRIGARIEYLEEHIQVLIDAKEYIAAAMQEKNLIKLYELYPELKKNDTPRTLKFTYGGKNIAEDLPTIEDAEFEIQKAIANG
jgi:hypothetical protein